ncbi:MAG: hypothetical protein H8E42_09315 [Nitrospinae bacterium]|nr:hypothetical protein [Nitrospinota bacterium]MBL7020691.1 hypothetical protein [Nitrospinaceae bacterium]
MANTTVTTQVVVQFDDQFTDAAKQANESYLKSLEEVRTKAEIINQNLNEVSEEYFNTLRMNINDLNALEFTLGIGSLTAVLSTLAVNTSVLLASLASVGVAMTTVYGTWLAGEVLNEWRVGDKPVDEYLEGVKESLEQVANSEPLALPPIPTSYSQMWCMGT